MGESEFHWLYLKWDVINRIRINEIILQILCESGEKNEKTHMEILQYYSITSSVTAEVSTLLPF